MSLVRLSSIPLGIYGFATVHCYYDHKIYIPGGEFHKSESARDLTGRVLGYNINQDSWDDKDNELPELTEARHFYSACSYGSVIFVLGGFDIQYEE